MPTVDCCDPVDLPFRVTLRPNAERVARARSMVDRWALADNSQEPDWDVEDFAGIDLTRSAVLPGSTERCERGRESERVAETGAVAATSAGVENVRLSCDRTASGSASRNRKIPVAAHWCSPNVS